MGAFDHYQSKVSSMQCKLDKLRAQDQEVKPNNEQRLLRNLAKLEAAKAGYDEQIAELNQLTVEANESSIAAFERYNEGVIGPIEQWQAEYAALQPQIKLH